MAETHVISALRDKRAELAGLVADLERRLQQTASDLGHLDATLRLFDPTVKMGDIRPKQAAPALSEHFQRGELASRCREALRIAGVNGVTAGDAALAAMKDKGIDPADVKVLDDFAGRMLGTFIRLGHAGLARKTGVGMGARWGLAQAG
jgi:hypothetical protein